MGSVPIEIFIFLIFLLSTTNASHNTSESNNEMITPNYTSLIWNVTYHSIKISHNYSDFFNGYYDFVLSIVDTIVPEVLPEGIKKALEDNDSIISLIPSSIWLYRRFVLFLLVVVGQIIFLLFGIFKTVCFFLSSGKVHSYATKSSSWKRRIFKRYGICMRLGWIHSYFTLLLFLIVLAHNSNEDIHRGTKTVTAAISNSVMDTETYIDTSTEQLEILLTNNLEEYLEFFIENAQRTAEEIIIDLESSVSNINLLGSFSGIEESFKPIEPILKEIKSLSQEMINITDGIIQGVMIDGNALFNGTLTELGKGIDLIGNLTGDITGDIIGAIENPSNFTSGIAEKTVEEVNKLKNLTTNVVGDVIGDLDKSGKDLKNITSSIGGEVIEGGKMLTNLTENIGEDVLTGLDKTKEAITDITSGITGGNLTSNIDAGVDMLHNFTENIGLDLIGSDIEEGGKSLSKIGDGIDKVADNVEKDVGGAIDGLLNFGNNEAKDVTKSPNGKRDPINEPVTTIPGKKEMKNVVGEIAGEVSGAVDDIFNIGGQKRNATTEAPDSKTAVTKADKPVNKPNDIVDDVISGAHDTVNNLFGFGDSKSESVTKEPSRQSTTTIKSNPKNDDALKTVADVKNETVEAVNNIFGLGGKTPDHVELTHKPDAAVAGGVNNIFNNGVDNSDSVTNAPEKEENGSVIGGMKNEVEGAVNNVFDFGNNNEKYVTTPPNSESGLGGAVNNHIDLRSGGTEDKSRTVDKSNKSSDSKKEKGNLVDNVLDEVGSASKKVLDLGDNLFGLRRKRELNMNFEGVIDRFRKILTTIDQLEHFMNVDLQNMNNMSVLLSPVIKEVGVVVRRVLDEVKEDIRLGAKPLEKIVDVAKKEVGEIKHELLSFLNVIFNEIQLIINVFEPIRYFITYFVSYVLLLAFVVLIIGMTTRIVKDNNFTQYVVKGGCTSLYIAAFIMACLSLVYIIAGVATQKLFCETFQGPNDNGVLNLIDEMNPINLGSHVNISVKRVIYNCHKDKSIYEVADLQEIFDLNEFRKYINIEDTEKQLREVLDFPLNFTKILPLEEFEKAEEILFDTFKEIMDSPVIKTIDSLEDKLGSLPVIGDLLRTFTGNLMSFQNNFNSLKSANSKNGNKSFFDELENAVVSVEKELTKLENNIMQSIEKITSKLLQRIIKSLTMYVEDRLIYSIQYELGRCKPLSLALNTTVDAICKDITSPANGHWFSWFTCVIISIIILIYSASHTNVLRKNSSNEQTNVLHVEEEEMHTIAIAKEAQKT